MNRQNSILSLLSVKNTNRDTYGYKYREPYKHTVKEVYQIKKKIRFKHFISIGMTAFIEKKFIAYTSSKQIVRNIVSLNQLFSNSTHCIIFFK